MSELWNDRTPPHNIEAEQAVIGAIFLDPEAMPTAAERLMPDDFTGQVTSGFSMLC